MPGAITVPRSLLVALSLGLAACTTPAEWSKPGADSSITAKDTSDCHIVAQQQAARQYPAFTSPYATGAAATMSQQHTDTDRAVAEAGYFDSCMQGKGYVRRAAPQANK